MGSCISASTHQKENQTSWNHNIVITRTYPIITLRQLEIRKKNQEENRMVMHEKINCLKQENVPLLHLEQNHLFNRRMGKPTEVFTENFTEI
jgi:hypothetical protein